MMAMSSTSVKNAGYILVLLPQLLFVLGVEINQPWLPVIFFFVLLPVLRSFVGNDLASPNVSPSPSLLFYFRTLPRLYCAIWAFVLAWTVHLLGSHSFTAWQWAGVGLSCWIVTSLNTAVAHEMIHSGSRLDRQLGTLMDASVGYFHFAEEHLSHHERTGHFHGGDAARPGTSIYAYAVRRYARSHVSAWEFETGRLRRLELPWWRNRVLTRALVPLVIAGAFYATTGWPGAVFYFLQILGAAFSVQAITYLQHWGLSQKETPELADFGFSWEDGCWMQACVTLNHAYHGHHHLNLRLPYYKLSMPPGALTLPGSYPVMFLLALVPPLFTKVMKARLRLWIDNAQLRDSMANEHNCVGTANMVRAVREG